MPSSDEEAANRAMYQPATTRVSRHPDNLYRERFKRKSVIVDCLGDKQGEGWEAWKGSKDTNRETETFSDGEDFTEDPDMMTEKEVHALPLGRVASQMAAAVEEARSGSPSLEPKESKDKPERKQQKWKKKRAPRCPSDSEFIVSDGEIDPPSKGEKKRGRKPAQKRKNGKKDTEMESEESEEEQAPKKKRGREEEEVVEVSPPKRRGRPPNRTVEESPKRKEKTKEDRKNEASSRKGGRRVEESEDADEIQLIDSEPESELRRSPRKETKGEKKRKRMGSEESQDEEPERNRRSARSSSRKEKEGRGEREGEKTRKQIVNSEEESEQEGEPLKTRNRSGKGVAGEKNKKKESRSGSEDSVMKSTKAIRKGNYVAQSMESLFEESASEDEEKKEKERERGKVGRRESRKRKKSMSEESEDEEEEESTEDEDMSSTSKGKRGKKSEGCKTAWEIHLKKEKQRKKRQKKADEKRKMQETVERLKLKKQAAADHHRMRALNRKDLRPEDTCPSYAVTCSEYFVARSGSRSRSPSVAPSTVGSRSVSREGSPVRGGPSMGDFDPERLARKLSLQKLKEEEQKEKEKKEREWEKKEKDREEREKNGQATAAAANPNEKFRVKAKVFMRGGRDAGIVDSGLPPANPVKRGGKTPLAPSFLPRSVIEVPEFSNPLDNITIEMELPLPSAPSVDRSLNGPAAYMNPTRVRMYAPESPIDPKEMQRRVGMQYGGTSGMDQSGPSHSRHPPAPGPRRPSDPRRPISAAVPATRGPSPLANGPSGSTGSLDLAPPSPVHDQVMDYASGPASPDNYNDGPASPEPMENGDDDDMDASDYGEDDINVLDDPLPVGVLRDRGHRDEEGDKRRANQILEYIVDNLKAGEFNEVLWALSHKFEHDNACHFDRTANRGFIFDLIDDGYPPSPQLLAGLSLVIRWDSHQCDRRRRMEQSRLTGDVHDRASLSLAVLPRLVERRGVVESRMTPLSHAVRQCKIQWAEFLLKAGSNVNERVFFDEFDGYIVQLAIDKSSEYPPTDIFNLVSLLLAYGANRIFALDQIDLMKTQTLEEQPQLTLAEFHRLVPFYERLHKLLFVACDSVSRAFKGQLQRHMGLTRDFVIDGVEETACSPPYLTHLVIQTARYIRPYLRSDRNSNRWPVFAIVVGMSPWDFMARNEDRSKLLKPQVNKIKLEHRIDEPPFTVFPCAFMNQNDDAEPRMNSVALEPLQDNMSIFVIPPQLYPRLKACTVYAHPARVHNHRIVFGCLVRLFLKGAVSEERRNDALRQLRGSSGHQFEGLY